MHFAAIPRVLIEPDNRTFEANVISTYNVIEAAMKLGVRKVIIASSETTYGVCFAEGDKDFHSFPLEEDYDIDPMDSYGLSKVGQREDRARLRHAYGADIYALRIGNVIEPHEYAASPPSSPIRCHASATPGANRRARPRRDRASLPGEGRARLSGVQRRQRHDHAEQPTEDFLARYVRACRSPVRSANTRRPSPTGRSARCLGFKEAHDWRKIRSEAAAQRKTNLRGRNACPEVFYVRTARAFERSTRMRQESPSSVPAFGRYSRPTKPA